MHDLAASLHPYRGNGVPAAKIAVTKLRGYITDMLVEERERAEGELNDCVSRLQTTPDFVALDASAQEQVLALSHEALSTIQAERFAPSIRDRLSRYTTREYPAQLALASRLAAEKHKPAPGSKKDTTPPVAPVHYTPASSLRSQCGLTFISTEAELDQWLAALKKAAQAELNQGNRISL